MRRSLLSLIVLAALAAAPGCRSLGRNIKPLDDDAPSYWAKRFVHEGLDDLMIIKRNDALYHCAQPTPEHFKAFAEMGIRTIVNVRRRHSDEKVVETLGMKYYSVPILPWGIKERDFVDFLRIAADPANRPLLVYCWYGGDRSNMLAAAHRIVLEGWSKDEAIREMTQGGAYFHWLWQNQVEAVRNLDVDRVRRLARIE